MTIDDANVPASGGIALLVIDMINDLDFPGSHKLARKADAVAEVVLDLRRQADALAAPVVYVNDNFGHWRSDRATLVAHCQRPDSPGRNMVQRVAPRHQDYFVIKPRFSGFYATNLPVLLPQLGVTRLVLTGIAADMCVLFTAADAHMRDYRLWIPADGVASEVDEHRDWALQSMRKSMDANVRPTGDQTLQAWVAATRPTPSD